MMKFIISLLLVVSACIFLKSCTPEEEYILVEKISKNWKISSLTVDGDVVTAGIDDFNLLLGRKGNQPTTYTIITGGLAYSFAPNITGSWSLNDTKNPTQITFSGSTVSLLTVSSEQLVIQYSFTDGLVEPIVKFTLVPR